jgi:hypothetical protein
MASACPSVFHVCHQTANVSLHSASEKHHGERNSSTESGNCTMRRRTFLGAALAASTASPLFAALRGGRWDGAANVLDQATNAKQVAAAVLHVIQGDESFTRHFGKAASDDAMFLLGSISKPINVTAVMTLFDQGKFQLDDLSWFSVIWKNRLIELAT